MQLFARAQMANVLSALHAATGNVERMSRMARQASVNLRQVALAALDVSTETNSHRVCDKAATLLKRCNPAMLDTFFPVETYGDGNCLFRALSSTLYGTDEHYVEMRLRAAVEVMLNQQYYDVSFHDCMLPCKDNPCLILPDYQRLCSEISHNGTDSDIMAVYAVSSVIGQPIQLYYPPITAQFQTSPLTCVVSGRGQAAARTASIVIMWSTGASVPAVGPVTINHFVPLHASCCSPCL